LKEQLDESKKTGDYNKFERSTKNLDEILIK
jgi:hypothetical protein